ncbi:MAG: invasion associated locus B family protein [Kiloniellaceae bacterium]
MGRTRPAWAVLGVAASVAVMAGGHAGEPEAWRYQCLGAESLDAEICTTEISIFIDNREFLVYFVHNEGKHTPLVVAGDDTPLDRVTIQVDDKAPVQTEDCESDACVFDQDTSKLLQRQFRKGRAARIVVAVSDGEGGETAFGTILDRRITLRGFSAAFAQRAR